MNRRDNQKININKKNKAYLKVVQGLYAYSACSYFLKTLSNCDDIIQKFRKLEIEINLMERRREYFFLCSKSRVCING